MAISTVVGQQIGRGTPEYAARATLVGISMAAFYTAAFGVLYVGFPDLLFAGFAAGIVDFEEVRDLAVVLLRFVAAYNLLDATLMVFVSAIKGAGDTPFVLKVSGIMASTMAFASWMAVEVWHLGIYGCWALLTCWVWTVGIIFCLRFLSGKWRKMRVIEQKAFDPALEPVQP